MNKRQQKLLDTAKNHPLRRIILQNKWIDHETIAQSLNISRQSAKQHLNVLKRCGLITYKNEDLISQRVYKVPLKEKQKEIQNKIDFSIIFL